MKRWMLGLLAILFSTTLAAAQQQPPTPVMPQPGEIPQIVAFDNDGLLGDHIHIFGDTPDLGKWGNSISSMVMLAGRWEFFDEEKLQGAKVELGPGSLCTSKTTASRIIVSRRSGLSVRGAVTGFARPLVAGSAPPEPACSGRLALAPCTLDNAPVGWCQGPWCLLRRTLVTERSSNHAETIRTFGATDRGASRGPSAWCRQAVSCG